jgi:hypothetical protein
MSLITTLKHDHEEIFRLLDESRALGITTDEGGRKLKQVRAVVVAHLKREDQKLYPEMQKHDATRALGHMYAREMRAISEGILGFFDALESGSGGLEFARTVSTFRSKPVGHFLPHLSACFCELLQKFQT